MLLSLISLLITVYHLHLPRQCFIILLFTPQICLNSVVYVLVPAVSNVFQQENVSWLFASGNNYSKKTFFDLVLQTCNKCPF
jgi:hypothetical protein